MGIFFKTPKQKLEKVQAELDKLNLEINGVFRQKSHLEAGSKEFAMLEKAQRELELLVQEMYVEKSRLLKQIKIMNDS